MKRFLSALVMFFSLVLYAQKPIKVACVGNSITYGTAVENREVNSYPSKLQNILGSKYLVGNFGKPGATLLSKGHRPYIQQKEYEDAINFAADIVVIHLGVNDTDPRNWPNHRDEFITDYLKLIQDFKKANEKAKIIICRMTPISDRHHRFRSGTRDWHEEIQTAIESVARIAKVQLTDLHSVLYKYPHLIPDGIHPDVKGAELIAKKIYGAITGDFGGLKMPDFYTDNMVLQRNESLTISGFANANEQITVSIGEQKVKTKANSEGQWSVKIMPLATGHKYVLSVESVTKKLVYNNVVAGEVWLCSGQSNMEFMLKQCSTAEQDIPTQPDDMIRMYDIKARWRTDAVKWDKAVLDSVNNLQYLNSKGWRVCSKNDANNFSAIGYYFAKQLRDSLNVPIGIICNAVGGSPTEAWIDRRTLEYDFPDILANWKKNDFIQSWVRSRASLNIANSENNLQRHPYQPAYLYECSIEDLTQLNIKGVIWYQGESNAHNKDAHSKLFKLLVESWRSRWKNKSLPFYFVQLSSLNRPSWTWFRDSQRELMKEIDNTAMVVSSDYGNMSDVHPTNKKPIGERLARVALSKVYGKNITPMGPMYKSARVVGRDVYLSFDYGEGLKAKDGKEIIGFELSGEDGIFHKAKAEVVGNELKVWSEELSNPKCVRYAWQPYTTANLVNRDLLPSSTFKSSFGNYIQPEIKLYTVDSSIIYERGIEKGVSAAFAGKIGDKLILAGGCNFPNTPASEGGKKVFYKGIYVADFYSINSLKWKKAGQLPEPLAYGASVSVNEGVVLIGGNNDKGASNKVRLLSLVKGKAKLTELPDLPYTLDNFAATSIGRRIYVCGGNLNGNPSNNVAYIDLNEIKEGWKSVRPFPGNERIQPVAFTLNDKENEKCLYVFGGFSPKHNGKEATLSVSGYKYSPSRDCWTKVNTPIGVDNIDISLGGGVATELTNNTAIAFGGVNKDIFLSALRKADKDYLIHPVEWYRFNKKILIYDSIKDTWREVYATDNTARAGAVIVNDGTVIYSINGEIKPGIRTPGVVKIEVKH